MLWILRICVYGYDLYGKHGDKLVGLRQVRRSAAVSETSALLLFVLWVALGSNDHRLPYG